MKIAFYRGKGDLITAAIRVLTWGTYSHVELVYSDGRWFSSSGRGNSGVRWRDDIDVTQWDFFELPAITGREERKSARLADRHVGRGFNWAGLWSFVFPCLDVERFKKANSLFCTEVVLLVLQESYGLLPDVARSTSPNRFYHLLTGTTPKPPPTAAIVSIGVAVGIAAAAGWAFGFCLYKLASRRGGASEGEAALR